MKINLSKEHMEAGGKMVGVYSMRRGVLRYKPSGRLVCDPNEPYVANKPLYRDFLQLVIEAIKDKDNNICIFIWRQEVRVYVFLVVDSLGYPIADKECEISKTRTEAKEKAIAYVLDNMEV